MSGNGSAQAGLGERLLAGGFRGICLVMRAAAHWCGTAAAEVPRPRANAAVDFQALALLGYVPLGEIAAAERELRPCAGATSPLAQDTGFWDEFVEHHLVPSLTSTSDPLRGIRLAPVRPRLSHGRA